MATAMTRIYNVLRNVAIPQFPERGLHLGRMTSFHQSLAMSTKVNILKWNHKTDGKLCNDNMKKKLEKLGCKCKQLSYTPGQDFAEHTHPTIKMDGITTGKFQMSMGGKTVVLEPGDIIEVPKNAVHSAKVVGKQVVTFFDGEK